MHICAVSMAKLHELKFELLPHRTYSPDLIPTDFFLFPSMKKWFARKKFESNEDVITETEAYFEEVSKSYILDGLKKSLVKVYRAARKLCWKIEESQREIMWLFML